MIANVHVMPSACLHCRATEHCCTKETGFHLFKNVRGEAAFHVLVEPFLGFTIVRDAGADLDNLYQLLLDAGSNAP